MGANAQTTVPSFSSGEVLTAANQNISAGTGVPVFAGTAERDAAFGGSGEKVLAEGQLCYLESTNVVQYYDGAAWATVGPASAGAMTYLTGAAFSAQTSVAFANSTFTSTYDYYLVMLDAAGDSAASNVSLQVRDNSGTKSGASYSGGGVGQLFNNTQSTFGVNGATSFQLMQATSAGSRNRCGWTIFVSSPASTTKATIWNGTATADPQTGASIGGWHFGGEYGVEEAHTGLTFTFSVASSGLYRVYGLANS
jgi:hypothetical protein